MFRSLFQDHLQGSFFALSAPTTFQLHASSFVCIGMWSYALYLYVYTVSLSVCCLVVSRPDSTQFFSKVNSNFRLNRQESRKKNAVLSDNTTELWERELFLISRA
jgi:hypothetical protein